MFKTKGDGYFPGGLQILYGNLGVGRRFYNDNLEWGRNLCATYEINMSKKPQKPI